MRQVSITALRSMLSQQVQEVFLKCIIIEHQDLTNVLMYVNDRKDLVRSDGTYLAAGFKLALPDDQEDSIGTIQLVVPLLTPNIIQAIRSTNDPFIVTLMVVRASAPDTVEVGPFVFESLQVDFDRQNATITLAFDRNIFEDAYPKDIFAPSNDPPLGVTLPPTAGFIVPEADYISQFTVSPNYILGHHFEPPLGGYVFTVAPLSGAVQSQFLSEFISDQSNGAVFLQQGGYQ